jgi:glutamate-ammonia-ligase adenylyltransferase
MVATAPPLLEAALAAATAAGLDANEATRVFACSDYLTESFARQPALFAGLDLVRVPSPEEHDAAFGALLAIADEPAFMAALRQLRRRESCRLAWQDLAGRIDPVQVLRDVSAVADAAIRVAHAFARRATIARFGTPRSAAGVEQDLVVVGMGKLGGRELNFSSDIDLVFLFPEDGETDRRGTDHMEFFTRLGQHLIRLLEVPTVDGFGYRVDMRLRPFGESGPLVASFAALEDYLQQHGRDWERYAWIKARAITGQAAYVELFRGVVRPFVFRRYLDFGVIESLREMKGMISREVQRLDRQDHVKLGPGGIREIEFIVQVFQLLRGGQEPALQPASLLDLLPVLAHPKRLGVAEVAELEAAYHFLRRVENRLQMVAEAQVHELPRDEAGRARMAAAMGYPDWVAFAAALAVHRDTVMRYFAAVVASSPAEAARAAETAAHAAAMPEAVATLLDSPYARRLDGTGLRRLEQLLPRLVSAAERTHDAAAALPRMLRVVQATGNRSTYLALLLESPLALARLGEIAALGDFLCDQVAASPLLLDELVDQRLFEELPSRAQFEAELALKRPAADEDPERQVEALRQFQRAAVFRVALWDLTGRLPLMQVSDRLTEIAELILAEAMRLGWEQMTAIYGEPRCGSAAGAADVRTVRLAAVGYGKLGGQELGYSSDLDLVFLHDSAGAWQQTAGPKEVENGVFFLRLGQRILHLLTIHSAAGRLYEVDTRLRPSGKGGFMVTPIEAFQAYQRHDAWTWEHQALLHSRDVAGAPELRERFREVREDVLCRYVRQDTLAVEVRNMRQRMRNELSRAEVGQFDLKQDPGGVADIEFLAQYWVLRWAGRNPPLAMFADTIRQLESVGSAALVDHRDIDTLVNAYREYRHLNHRLALAGSKAVVDAAPWAAMRAAVQTIWEATFSDAGDAPVL